MTEAQTELLLNPEDISETVAAMDETTLLARREELQALGRNKELRPDGLLEDELQEICAIYARLRTKKATVPGSKSAVNRRAKHIDINDLPL